MKKSKKFLICTIVVALVLSMSVMFVGCKKKNTDPVATTYVSMDMNPSVEFILDEKNLVMDVVSANQDAAILLTQTEGVVGATVEVASKKVIDAAVELKYLNNEDTKNVSVQVNSGDAAKAEAILNDTKLSIKAELDTKQIKGQVEAGVDFLLEKELETVKEHKADTEGYANLTVSKYRLVKRAILANVTLTMDEAVLMSEAELIKTIDYAKDEVKYAYDAATAYAIRLATDTYNMAKNSALNIVYPYVYGAAKNQIDKTKPFLATRYIAMDAATRTFEKVVFEIRNLIDNIQLEIAPIKTILKKAGLTDEQLAKLDEYDSDNNKKLTKADMMAYLEKLYRNMSAEERAAFEGKYDASVKLQVNDFEAQANAKIDAKAGALKAAIKAPGLDLNIDIKTGFTIDDIDTIIAKLHKATDNLYDQMMDNMTDQGKKNLDKKMNEVNDKFTEAETKLNNAIAKANENAEALVKEALKDRVLKFNLEIEVA